MNIHQKINEHFRATVAIFLVLVVGMLLFLAISIWLVQGNYFEPGSNMDNLFQIIIPFVGFATMFISRYIYKN